MNAQTTKVVTKVWVLAALVVLSGCTSMIRPNFTPEVTKLREGQYQLDPAHSFLLFQIEHLGLSKIAGRFNQLQATMDFDPQNPLQLKLDGIVSADSVDLNNSELENMLQEGSWFDSDQFPQIVFNSGTVSHWTC